MLKKYRKYPRRETRNNIPEPYGRLANQFADAGWAIDFQDDPETVLFIKKGQNAFGLIYGDNAINEWSVYDPTNGELITQFQRAKDLFRIITYIIE